MVWLGTRSLLCTTQFTDVSMTRFHVLGPKMSLGSFIPREIPQLRSMTPPNIFSHCAMPSIPMVQLRPTKECDVTAMTQFCIFAMQRLGESANSVCKYREPKLKTYFWTLIPIGDGYVRGEGVAILKKIWRYVGDGPKILPILAK